MNNSHASLTRIYTASTGSTVDENARNQPDVGEPADPDSDVFVEAAVGNGIGNTSMPYRVLVTWVAGVYPQSCEWVDSELARGSGAMAVGQQRPNPVLALHNPVYDQDRLGGLTPIALIDVRLDRHVDVAILVLKREEPDLPGGGRRLPGDHEARHPGSGCRPGAGSPRRW